MFILFFFFTLSLSNIYVKEYIVDIQLDQDNRRYGPIDENIDILMFYNLTGSNNNTYCITPIHNNTINHCGSACSNNKVIYLNNYTCHYKGILSNDLYLTLHSSSSKINVTGIIKLYYGYKIAEVSYLLIFLVPSILILLIISVIAMIITVNKNNKGIRLLDPDIKPMFKTYKSNWSSIHI